MENAGQNYFGFPFAELLCKPFVNWCSRLTCITTCARWNHVFFDCTGAIRIANRNDVISMKLWSRRQFFSNVAISAFPIKPFAGITPFFNGKCIWQAFSLCSPLARIHAQCFGANAVHHTAITELLLRMKTDKV